MALTDIVRLRKPKVLTLWPFHRLLRPCSLGNPTVTTHKN